MPATPAAPAAELPIPLLEQALASAPGIRRFTPALEAPYLAERADAVAPRRLALIGAALVLVGIAPVLNAFVLHPPAAFNAPALFAQFGVMIPALLAAGLATLLPRLRRWQDPVAAPVMFMVSAGLMFQRHVGAALGFVVPVELVGVVLLGTAVLAGLRFAYVVPTVVAIVVAFAWNEIATFGAGPTALNATAALVMMAVLSTIGSYMEERGSRAAWLQRKLLEQLAVRDALTGLSNVRAFRERWPALHARAQSEGLALLIAMVDIDWFKQYNDHYGHLPGDECIRRVAHALRAQGRGPDDLQARLGGDEFALAWQGVPAADAAALLEGMRAAVRSLAIAHAGSRAVEKFVTVSIGALHVGAGAATTPETALQEADRRLYQSKEQGRGRVTLALSPPP